MMSDPSHPAYRHAFVRYLRRGTPITATLSAYAAKAQIGKYVWRTKGDDNVRASHAVNNGQIFDWNNPPITGNPGTEYGCRCIAEPYDVDTEYAYQTILGYEESFPKWLPEQFLRHYYLGDGAGLSLRETGHLNGVIDHFFFRIFKDGQPIYDRINDQICTMARRHINGDFAYDFYDAYSFANYLPIFGGGMVSGILVGKADLDGSELSISGDINYIYEDVFTDPASIRQNLTGSSDTDSILTGLTDFAGKHFIMKDRWTTGFQARIHVNPERSIYGIHDRVR